MTPLDVTDSTTQPADRRPPRRIELMWVVLAGVVVLAGALVAMSLASPDPTNTDAAVDPSATEPPATDPPTTTVATTTTEAVPVTEPSAPPTTTSSIPPPTADGSGPLRIFVGGDSVASQFGWALQAWSEANPGQIVVFNESHIGCGVVRYGLKRVDDEFGPVGDICSGWNDPVALHEAAETHIVSWPSAIELFQPDVSVSIVSSWDITDRIVPGVVEDWASVGVEAYDRYVLGEYTVATEVLSRTGADTYWLMTPDLRRTPLPPDHPMRVDRINELVVQAIGSVSERNPDASISTLDYPGFIGEIGSERELQMRDDGVHLSTFGADEVARWILTEVGVIEPDVPVVAADADTGTEDVS